MADPSAVVADLSGNANPPIDDAVAKAASGEALRKKGEADVIATAAKGDKLAADQAAERTKFKAEHSFTPPKLQPPPEAPVDDPLKAFGSSAVTLGILMSALTRQPLTNALNATSTAMEAIKANDLEKFKQAKDTWKENVELAQANAKWELDGYNYAASLMKEDHAASWAAWTTHMNAAQNQAMLGMGDMEQLLRSKEGMARISEINNRNTEQLWDFAQKQQAKMERDQLLVKTVTDALPPGTTYDQFITHMAQRNLPQGAWQNLKPEQQAELKQQADAGVKGNADRQLRLDEERNKARITDKERATTARVQRTGESYDVASAAVAKELAQGAAEGRLGAVSKQVTQDTLEADAVNWMTTGKVPTGRDMAGYGVEVKNRGTELMRKAGLTPQDIAAMPAERKAYAASLAKNVAYEDSMARTLTELDGMFDIAKSYRDQLDLTTIQSVNKAILKGQTEFGDAATNNYANAMAALAMTYGRMLAGPQSSAMTPVAAMDYGMTRLGPALSEEQFMGEKEQMRKEGQNVLRSTHQIIESDRARLRLPGASPAPMQSPQQQGSAQTARPESIYQGLPVLHDTKNNTYGVMRDGKPVEIEWKNGWWREVAQ